MNRSVFLRRLVIGVWAIAYLLGCSTKQKEAVELQLPLLGTWVRFVVMAEDRSAAGEAIQGAIRKMEAIEQACNYHDEDSELSKVNRLASKQPVPVSEILWEVLSRSVNLSKETEGAFDPTIAPLVRLWGIGTDHQRVPDQEGIDRTLLLVSCSNVDLDPREKSVFYLKEGVEIDLGAVAKGYACDVAKDLFLQLGFDAVLIQAGGSVTAVGRKDSASFWQIGIQDPRGEGIFYSFSLQDRSVATSGDYQNYFLQDGVRYHHLLSPLTGRPVKNSMSATVLCPNAMDADAYSTAAMVWSDEPDTLQTRMNRALAKGIEMAIVDAQGKIVKTGQWDRLPEGIPSR